MKRVAFFFIFCFLMGKLVAKGPPIEGLPENLEIPWLTGPLLTPTARTVPMGHVNIEPYIYANNFKVPSRDQSSLTTNTNHNVLFQLFTQVGATPWMAITIIPDVFYSWNKGADAWRFGDLLIGTSFQLTQESWITGMPAIVFVLNEIFPTGTYQRLNPSKFGTDGVGTGSYTTAFGFVASRLWHFYSTHFLAARISVRGYAYTPVSVRGINSYGGDKSTKGHVYPGFSQTTLIGLEYTLTQQIALALDLSSVYSTKIRFHGKTTLPVGSSTYAYVFSLAPAIEYNFNQNVGLIAGIWFSAYTRHARGFTNGIIALNVYI